MRLKLSFLFYLFAEIYGNDQNNFIIDYFVYKNVPTVVGFSCEDDQDINNIALIKRFNKIGIKATFLKLNIDSPIHYMMYTKYWKLGIYLDMRCMDNDTVTWLFSEASNWRLFGEMHCWLTVGADLGAVMSTIDDGAFGLSTDFVVALPAASGSAYELHDAYNPWKDGGGQFNVTRMGSWSPAQGLNVTLTQSKFVRRANLRGINMRASFFGSKYRPKNVSIEDYLQDYSTKSKDGLSKFGYNILVHLSEMFNISFQFGEVQTWRKGDTLGPLSRALKHNQIQITGSPVVMTTERLGQTKFVYPTWPFRTCFIFRNPQPQDIKINEVLRPFTIESWYLTFIFLVLCVVVLGCTFGFEGKSLSRGKYSNSALIVIGAFCQQGTNFTMDKESTRIAFIHVILFSFLIYTYYSAGIVSARLNEPIVKMNDSLNELAKADLKLASEPMIYFEFITKRLPPWERQGFLENRWLRIPEEERFMYPEKAMRLVKEGELAYHTHPDVGYPIIDRTFSFREICELMEVHVAQPVFATIAITYNSSFLEMTKVGFAKMSEVGIRHRQLTRWTSSRPRCRNDIINVSSTDIYEFAPHLIILLMGMVFAAAILIFEKFIDNYSNKKKYHRNCALFIQESFRGLMIRQKFTLKSSVIGGPNMQNEVNGIFTLV